MVPIELHHEFAAMPQHYLGQNGLIEEQHENEGKLVPHPSKYMSKLQIEKLKRFKERYSKASQQVRHPYVSCNTSIQSGSQRGKRTGATGVPCAMTNNFVGEEAVSKDIDMDCGNNNPYEGQGPQYNKLERAVFDQH